MSSTGVATGIEVGTFLVVLGGFGWIGRQLIAMRVEVSVAHARLEDLIARMTRAETVDVQQGVRLTQLDERYAVTAEKIGKHDTAISDLSHGQHELSLALANGRGGV